MSTPRRFQFGLRSALVLFTLTAVAVWWFLSPRSGVVSEWQARQIKVGMSRVEVVRRIGEGQVQTMDYPSSRWSYRVSSPFRGESGLYIEFRGHTVSVIRRIGRIKFAAP